MSFFAVFFISFSSVNAAVTVTYGGNEGIQNQILTPYCVACHHAGSAPQVDLTTYAGASANSGLAITYINSGYMPFSAADLSTTLQNLATSWGGAPEYAKPDLTTDNSPSNITSSQASLNSTVHDNGSEASYSYQYDTNSGSPYSFSTAAADNNSVSGGGANSTNDSATATITGLSCDNTYFYRLVGSNSAGTTNGAEFSFSTPACNKVPLIKAIPEQVLTEDVEFTYQVETSDQDGNNSDSLIFSLTDSPDGMTINASSGLITWLPTSETLTNASVSIRLIDINADSGFTTDTATFSIVITLVDEVPVFDNPPSSATILQDVPYQVSASATDPEGSNLTYAMTSDPDIIATNPALNINSTSGLISWTPDRKVAKVNITVTVSDGNKTNDQQHTFTLNVLIINSAPVITVVGNQELFEESPLSVDINATDDDGDTIIYSLTTFPENMTINSETGVISWTITEVAAGEPTLFPVIVSVTDNIANPVTESFSVIVTPINDQPLFLPLSDETVEELSLITINAAAVFSDPDDDNNGSGEIQWQLINQPEEMTISEVGVINWLPGQHSANDYSITITVADGLEDGSEAQQQNLNLKVTLLDEDGDDVADYDDNCPQNVNPEQADLDQDEIGDGCDLDIDGDGIPNTVEEENSLNPRDATDADEDLDGDGLSNLEEYQHCLANGDDTCAELQFDNNPPMITVENLIVAATGYYTQIQLIATAFDFKDGDIIPEVNRNEIFRPGRHSLIWSAADISGNLTTIEQIIDVLPLASLAGSAITGEGNIISAQFSLNGDAPEYPVTFSYSVSGTADFNDHGIADGTLELASGQTITLNINILEDNIAEADEDFTISLTSVSTSAILSSYLTFNGKISEQPLAPIVNLSISQNNINSTTTYLESGEIKVIAQATDGNGDPLNFDWSNSSNQINASINSNEYTFDPQSNNLLTGTYFIEVIVSDGVLQTVASITINLLDNPPILSAENDSDNDGIDDITEGLNDTDNDGILDYLDAINDVTLLQTQVGNEDIFEDLIETQKGFSIRMGETALGSNEPGAMLSTLELTDDNGEIIADSDVSNFGGVFDFEIHQLTPLEPTAVIVIPLSQFIPTDDAQYRKIINNNWIDFVVTETDKIRSAKKNNGLCPPPLDEKYQTGLIKFAQCIELTLTDGGPNDNDGLVNGVIKDPGGVSIKNSSNQPPTAELPPTEASAGSGIITKLLIILLLVIYFIRIVKTRVTKYE